MPQRRALKGQIWAPRQSPHLPAAGTEAEQLHLPRSDERTLILRQPS